ncbi:MAG: 2'-5' RNA ligase family protein [Chitinophagaceae bacterium]
MKNYSTGNNICEYRLLVPFPHQLQEKINNIRKQLHHRHNLLYPFLLPPSLTILKCHAFEKIEPKLLEKIQDLVFDTPPFSVELQNFTSFPTHTIYVEINSKAPFNDMIKQLKKMKWLMNIPGYEPQFIPEPHLIMAQALKPQKFNQMWRDCENRTLQELFLAESLLLVKRSEHQQFYSTVRRMQLNTLPMNIKQGELLLT